MNENMPFETTENTPVETTNFTPAKTTELTPAETEENAFTGIAPEIMSQLTPAKVRCILLWITGQYTKQKIAKIIGVSLNTVSAWLMNPIVQEAVRQIQGREFQVVESRIKAINFQALDTMEDLMMNSEMDNVRFSAAKDILDRGGHKPQQSYKVEKTVTNLESQLSQLADFTIDDSEIIDIDIDDIVSEVKGER